MKIFFRTNQKTCNEWFWRIRLYIINISFKCGCYELAVRQSYEYIQYYLQQNLTNSSELDNVIIILVKSLIKLKSWQSLIGLNLWLNQTLKKSYDWIKSASFEAQEKLETASDEYKKQIRSTLDDSNQNKQLTMTSSNFSILKFQSDQVVQI